MKKFDIIYADPAWSYWDKLKHLWAWAASHYDVMSVEDIAWLDVHKIANNDSVLILWATMPLLDEALKVIKGWGFKYKTCFACWIKTYPVQKEKFVLGMWHYSRSNIEICLLATRWKALPVINHSVSQLCISPRRSHSQKPNEIRDKIEAVFWKKRRIELFSRNDVNGWTTVGNEIGETIEEFIADNFSDEKKKKNKKKN